jgi:hypothetical protein
MQEQCQQLKDDAKRQQQEDAKRQQQEDAKRQHHDAKRQQQEDAKRDSRGRFARVETVVVYQQMGGGFI